LAACASGCSGTSEEEAQGGTSDEIVSGAGPERLVYFHGMSHLGFSRDALEAVRGTQSLLAPSLTDGQLSSPPSASVLSFVAGGEHATVAGYSLGRVPVLRMMQQNAPGITRVVLVDPTYDSASGIGKSIGGHVGRAWLDGGEDRTLLLVYGDSTKSLGGEKSYVAELAQHPRAEICYLKGDHERFRQADMAQALVASSCADLRERLDPSAKKAAVTSEPPSDEAAATETTTGDKGDDAP
jgi:hypothetical protein